MAINSIFEFQKADRDSVQTYYELTGYNGPPDDERSLWETSGPIETVWFQDQIRTSYEDEFLWTFSDGTTKQILSGTKTFSNLESGTDYLLRVKIELIRIETVVKYQRKGTQNEDGVWKFGQPYQISEPRVYEDVIYSDTHSLRAWTQPAVFQWSGNISSGQIIEDELTADDWNLLRQTARQKKQWLSQSNETACGGKATKGAYVTARIFNTVADYIGYNKNVEVGDEVKARYFIGLQTQVNKTT